MLHCWTRTDHATFWCYYYYSGVIFISTTTTSVVLSSTFFFFVSRFLLHTSFFHHLLYFPSFFSLPVLMYLMWPYLCLTALLYLYICACKCQLFTDEGSRRDCQTSFFSVLTSVFLRIKFEMSLPSHSGFYHKVRTCIAMPFHPQRLKPS